MGKLPRVLAVLCFITLVNVVLGPSAGNAQCMTGGASPGWTLFTSTGDASLDRAFREESQRLNAVFGITPRLFALDDSSSSNAFGMRLLREELWTMNRGPVAIAGILAHEYAHLYTCKVGTNSRGKRNELIADYLAGYYLGLTNRLGGGNINGFANSLVSKGDFNFTDPDHHGTPAERVAAMVAGYRSSEGGGVSASEAMRRGFTYLSGDSDPRTERRPRRRCRTMIVPCNHQAHPAGDQMECQHIGVTNRQIPCQHPCPGPYGPVPCHRFDVMPERMQAHKFDVTPCRHPAHPGGHEQQECTVE